MLQMRKPVGNDHSRKKAHAQIASSPTSEPYCLACLFSSKLHGKIAKLVKLGTQIAEWFTTGAPAKPGTLPVNQVN